MNARDTAFFPAARMVAARSDREGHRVAAKPLEEGDDDAVPPAGREGAKQARNVRGCKRWLVGKSHEKDVVAAEAGFQRRRGPKTAGLPRNAGSLRR